MVDALIPPGPLSDIPPYNRTLDNGGNTQVCRIYHLGVASTDTTHCTHGTVSGNSACGASLKQNVCKFIGGVCGFGTAAWQTASQSACETDLGSLALGQTKPQDTANNTFECRVYHATVAASFLPGGASADVANATDKFQYHCGHTIKNALKDGCGYVAAPTAAPITPTPASNSASLLSSLASMGVVALSIFLL